MGFNIIVIALILITIHINLFYHILYSPRVKIKTTLYYFIGGIISTIVVLLITDIISVDIDLFKYQKLIPVIDMFYNIGFIEEISKTILFILVYFIINKKEYSYLNIIFYMVVISLGFAFTENCMYAMGYNEPIKLLFIRTFTATLAHTCAGLLVGHGLGVMLKKLTKYGFFVFLGYLGIAIFIHGLYDYVIVYHSSISSLIIILIIMIYTYEFILKRIKNQIIPNE